MNLSKIEGHTGVNLGFNGSMKKPLTKSPILFIKTNIFYHNLEEGVFDQRFYHEGEFLVGKISISKKEVKNLIQLAQQQERKNNC